MDCSVGEYRESSKEQILLAVGLWPNGGGDHGAASVVVAFGHHRYLWHAVYCFDF